MKYILVCYLVVIEFAIKNIVFIIRNTQVKIKNEQSKNGGQNFIKKAKKKKELNREGIPTNSRIVKEL